MAPSFLSWTAEYQGLHKLVVGHEGDPYEELCRKFPACDWEYMEKRENGQLLMDLGMGFSSQPG